MSHTLLSLLPKRFAYILLTYTLQFLFLSALSYELKWPLLNLNLSDFPQGGGTSYIDSYAFAECGNQCDDFLSIKFYYNPVQIMPNAFYNCTKIKEIIFDFISVKIDNNAFRGCYDIKRISFLRPNGCTLENGAFKDQVDNNCEFYIRDTSTININYYKNKLIDCGVPESLITTEEV